MVEAVCEFSFGNDGRNLTHAGLDPNQLRNHNQHQYAPILDSSGNRIPLLSSQAKCAITARLDFGGGGFSSKSMAFFLPPIRAIIKAVSPSSFVVSTGEPLSNNNSRVPESLPITAACNGGRFSPDHECEVAPESRSRATISFYRRIFGPA